MKNREIKFRIPHFDSKTKVFSHFSYWGTIDTQGKPSLDGGVFTSPSANSGTTKGWHEQATGLVDKNGKEIYEGDWVLYWTDRFPDSKHKAKIVYNSNIASFQLSYPNMNGHWVTDNIHPHNLEVIGNIHANPDPLK